MNTLTAVAISRCGKTAASAERLPNGFSIHLWEIDSQVKKIEFGLPVAFAPYLIRFYNRDENLLVACARADSPIFAFSNRNGELVQSFFLTEFVCDLVLTHDLAGFCDAQPPGKDAGACFFPNQNLDFSFFAVGLHQISYFCFEKGEYQKREFNFFPKQIASAIAVNANLHQPELELFDILDDFEVCLVVGFTDGSIALYFQLMAPQPKLREIVKLQKPVLKIVYYKSWRILALTIEPTLCEIQLNCQESPSVKQLVQYMSKVASTELKALVMGPNDTVFILSVEGDLFEIDLRPKKAVDKNINCARRIETIKLPANLCCLKVIEREDETLVFVAGQNASVYGFTASTHQLIDTWSVGEAITALDVVSNREGGLSFAVGTREGKVKLRIDWEENPKCFSADKEILAVRFSEKGDKLIVASENLFLYVFSLEKWGLEGELDKFSPIAKPILTLTFALNEVDILVSYLNELPAIQNIKHQENVKTAIFKGAKLKMGTNPAEPIYIAPSLSLVATAQADNTLTLQRVSECGIGTGLILYGHGSPLVDLEVSQKQFVLYSLGRDQALFEWKLEKRWANKFVTAPGGADWPEAEKMVREEILACSSFNLQASLKESFGYFRGFNSNTVQTIFKDIYNPLNEEDLTAKNYPEVSLKLEYVFGVNCGEKRNKVFFLHMGKYPE